MINVEELARLLTVHHLRNLDRWKAGSFWASFHFPVETNHAARVSHKINCLRE